MENNLNEIFTQCWGKLLYGSMIADNAFHTGVVGTQMNGVVNLRTVVLRETNPDDKQVVFYTDSRSAKMKEIATNPIAGWLFWDGTDKVQIRLSGTVSVNHLNEVCQYHWRKVNAEGKKSYMANPGPSTGVADPTDGLEHLKGDDTDLETGYDNFAVIVTQVDFIEWLTLSREGHRRAQFKLIENAWKGQWLIP